MEISCYPWRKQEPLRGLTFYQLLSMDFFSTKKYSLMHWIVDVHNLWFSYNMPQASWIEQPITTFTALPTMKMEHVSHQGTGVLMDSVHPLVLCISSPCTHLSLYPSLHLLQNTWSRREEGLWSSHLSMDASHFTIYLVATDDHYKSQKQTVRWLTDWWLQGRGSASHCFIPWSWSIGGCRGSNQS